MPSVSVNDRGASWYYEDSGIPNGAAVYTTIVIVHGFAFHSGTYRFSKGEELPLLTPFPGSFFRLFEHAAAHGVRIITANVRDYPGSTPYTQDELERFWSTDMGVFRAATRDKGLELGTFLVNVITSEDVPVTENVDGKESGGVVLVCWSFGNIWSMSLLANEQELDVSKRDILRRYLRVAVMYGERVYST